MSDWVQAKTLVESKEVEAAKDEAAQRFDRFEEQWIGLTWLLARRGAEISASHKTEGDTKFYLYKAASTGKGLPEVVVLYTETDDEITIHGMQAHGGAKAEKTATVTDIRSRS